MKIKNRKALLIGNFNYTDKQLFPLHAPKNNVKELKKILGNSKLIHEYELTVILNCTLKDMEKVIEEYFSNNSQDDHLLFYFSGYGKRDTADNKLYLYAKNTIRKNLSHTAYNTDKLRKLVECSGAKIKVLFIDCCVDERYDIKSDMIQSGNQNLQPILDCTGRGVAALTASYKLKSINEAKQLKYSFFTQHIIQGIMSKKPDANTDNKITFEEFVDYILLQYKENAKDQEPHRNISSSYEIPVIEYKKEMNTDEKNTKKQEPKVISTIKPVVALKGWNEIKEKKEYSFFITYIGILKNKNIKTGVWSNYIDHYFKSQQHTNQLWKLWVDREYFNDRIYRCPMISLTDNKPLSVLFKIFMDKQYNDFQYGFYQEDIQVKIAFIMKNLIYKKNKDTIDKTVNNIFHLADSLAFNRFHFIGNTISYLPERLTNCRNSSDYPAQDSVYSITIKDIMDTSE